MPRLLFLLPLVLTTLTACTGTSPDGSGPFATETVSLEAPEGAGYVPTLEGPLRLLSATPNGTMTSMLPGQPITVTFTRPMVPLGEAPDVPVDQLILEPKVPGTHRWEGTQTLLFQPDRSLPLATRFRATLAPGLTAVDGSTWTDTYTWTFETPRPQLMTSEPADGERFVDLQPGIRLIFNQALDTTAARRFITLQTPHAETVAIATWAEGDSVFVVRPQAPLERGTTYMLTLRAGLPSAVGPLGLAAADTVRFRTYDPLRLEALTQRGHNAEQSRFQPGTGLTLTFSTPVSFGALRKAVAFEPAVALPPGIEARDDVVSTEHTLPVDLAPETAYTLTVGRLTDAFGQTMEPVRRTFRTQAYAPDASMPRGLLVIEADEQAVVLLRVTNLDAVRAGFRRLNPDEIIPLLPSYGTPYTWGEQPTTDPVTLRRLPLDAPPNQPTPVPLRLDSLLRGGTGVVALRLETPVVPGVRQAETYRALAQVTRLGVTAKFSPQQNLVFVTDLRTAQPVAGAAVTIRDKQNTIRWRGTTDAQGRARTPGWGTLGLVRENPWEQPVQYAFVMKDEDLAFTSSAYDDGIEPYRFDVPFDWNPAPVTEAGSVFTDRGLYRAGDSVFVKAILRRRADTDWQALRDSVRVLIRDSRDNIVYDSPFQPSDLGTFDLAWRTTPTAAQGLYDVRIVHAGDTLARQRSPWEPGDIAHGTFRVDAFRRATFAVTASASAPNYVAGDFFEGTLTGRYLFGASMQGQPATYHLYRTPTTYEPPGYPGYRFGTFRFDGRFETLARADTTLGPDGSVELRTQLPGDPQGTPGQLTWGGTVTDPARQEIAATATYTLHPGLFYIGLKPQTTFLDLSRTNTLGVNVITVDPAGQPVAVSDLEVTLVRQQWHSVREMGMDGRLRWRSEPTEEAVGRQRIRTAAGRATRLTLPVREGGQYVVRAAGHDVRGNAVQTEAYFYATGNGYVAWERSDDDRIELTADATIYRPGETARLLVQSPYEQATALITVEREGILSSRVETLTGSAPQVEIPLTEAHLPNVFVSVILLNGRTADPGPPGDPGGPSFKIGYTELRVDPGQRHLQVAVQPNQPRYQPGDEVTVTLQLRDANGRGVPGEIAFSAADAGVIDLIGYALPDPFDTFYGPRPLAVRTSESLAHLVRQRSFGQKSEDLGGGGGESSDAMLRRDFRPLAHWAPAIHTDRHGQAILTFRLPESLTTFRLMATALSTDQRFGAGRTDIVVTQPLVLQPALPRFARLDDSFEAGVLVTNTTGGGGEVTVQAQAEGLALQGTDRRKIHLRNGETREVRFRWQAAAAGDAKLTFQAQLGSTRDAFTTTLPIAQPALRQTEATFASTEQQAEEALRLPVDRVPGLGRFEARLSSTALVGLDGAARYLFEYPYGCLEQRTSRIRPLLAADALLHAFDLDVLEGDRSQVIDEWLRDLSDFWTGQGFAMWVGGSDVNPYVGAYTVLALAEAEAAGFQVPEPLTTQAVEALAAQVRNRSARPDYYDATTWNDTRALMLYALARHGRVLESELNTLAEQTGTLSVEGTSLLLRTLVQADRTALNRYRAPLLSRLRTRVRVEPTQAYLSAPDDPAHRWIFTSDVRATAFGLAALVEADPSGDIQALGERMIRYLMAARQGGHWATTQDNAAVIDAFRAYFQAFEGTPPDFAATVRVAGRELLQATFAGRSLEVPTAYLEADALPSGETLPVTITKQGTGRAYYTLLLETYSTAPLAAEANGLSIERRLQRLNDRGQPVGEPLLAGNGDIALAPGALVRVTLRLASPTDRTYVVVDDALPAGLEALNATFQTTSQEVLQNAQADADWWSAFNHTEIRDDRVVLFADHLPRGTHTFTYVARATTPGTFVHPPVQAAMMYEPAVNGHSATGTLVVQTPELPLP